jgi:hypothetical protein
LANTTTFYGSADFAEIPDKKLVGAGAEIVLPRFKPPDAGANVKSEGFAESVVELSLPSNAA